MPPRIRVERGDFVMTASDQSAFEAHMHNVGIKADVEEMRALGAELVIPITTIADYIEWANKILMPRDLAIGDEIRIIKERYDIQAFQTSVDGQLFITRAGYTWAILNYGMFDCAFEIHWDDLAYSPFDVLAQKVKRAAEELARKRDGKAQSAIEAACTGTAGHNPSVEGGAITKAAIDNVFQLAAGIGTPIKNVTINAATVLAMRGWSSWPFFLPPEEVRQLLYTGFIGEYGGANWFSAYTVPANEVFFGAEQPNIGWTIRKGDLRAANDINIQRKTNVYSYDEKRSVYVANPYALWMLTINA